MNVQKIDKYKSGVSCIKEDNSHTYWYVQTFGGDCFKSQDGTNYKQTSTPFRFFDLIIDKNGDIWGVGETRIAHYVNSKWKVYSVPVPTGPGYINTLAFDNDNTPYIGCNGSLLKLNSSNKWEDITPPSSFPNTITVIEFDSKGQMWLGTVDGLLTLSENNWKHWDVNDWGGYGKGITNLFQSHYRNTKGYSKKTFFYCLCLH